MQSVIVTTITYDSNTVSFGTSASFGYADSIWCIGMYMVHNTKDKAIMFQPSYCNISSLFHLENVCSEYSGTARYVGSCQSYTIALYANSHFLN